MIKKKFKEEKNQLETDKKRTNTQLTNLKTTLEQADAKFYSYKVEVE